MGTPGHNTKHLWIALSDPAKNGGEFVIVNLTDIKHIPNATCVLDVGDHRWITKPSAVHFADARGIKDDAKLKEAIRRHIVIPEVPLAHSVVDKIKACALTSPEMSDKLKSML